MKRQGSVPLGDFVERSEVPGVNEIQTKQDSALNATAYLEAFRWFDGRLKSVRRSSGGLAAAQPCQIVVVNTDYPKQVGVRLRVRFKDLTVQIRDGELVAKCLTHTKIVAPEELHEPLTYHFNLSQQFVLDIGHGIVPVQVVHYDRDAEGVIRAHFIDNKEIENAVQTPLGGSCEIQTYQVPRAVLRYATPRIQREGKSDLEIARENYSRMERLRAVIFPSCLAFGSPLEVPGGVSAQDIRDYLQLTLVKRTENDPRIHPILLSSLNTEEELL